MFLIEMIGPILLAKVSEGLVDCFDLERRYVQVGKSPVDWSGKNFY